jgi:hypothetical protein
VVGRRAKADVTELHAGLPAHGIRAESPRHDATLVRELFFSGLPADRTADLGDAKSQGNLLGER